MKSSAIGIRRASATDLETLTKFNIAMALETEDHELDAQTVRSGVARLFQQPERGFYLIAESGPTMVGSLMITQEWSDWRDGLWWWIQSVYVQKTYRRRGVFRTLYRKVAELARTESDICGIRLYVEKSNKGAQSVYRRMGMEETEYRLFEQLF